MGLTHTEEAVGSLGMEIGLGELGSIVTWGLGWWDDHLGLGESSELCGTGWQRHLLGGGGKEQPGGPSPGRGAMDRSRGQGGGGEQGAAPWPQPGLGTQCSQDVA